MQQPTFLKIAFGISFTILFIGLVSQIVSFNNQMINLQELKKAEIETAKVEFGQCIVKITEVNQIAKAYMKDVLELSQKAGDNLEKFNSQLIGLIGTQVIPTLSPSLRENVQQEIISCRNSYTARIDLSLKPMYITYNKLQKEFPNNLYNKLFFNWKTEDLILPKNEAGKEGVFK